MIRANFRKTGLWFRQYSVHLSVAIIVLAFSSILVLLAQSQNKLTEQSQQNEKILVELKGVTTRLANGATTRTEQYDALNRHLDCIVVFFSQPDRSSKSISDIDTCTLKENGSGTTTTPVRPTTQTQPTSQTSTTPSTPTSNAGGDPPPAVKCEPIKLNVLFLLPVQIGC